MSNPLSPPPRDRDGARRKAQNHFELAEARTSLVKQMVDAERAAHRRQDREAESAAPRQGRSRPRRSAREPAAPPAKKTRAKA